MARRRGERIAGRVVRCLVGAAVLLAGILLIVPRQAREAADGAAPPAAGVSPFPRPADLTMAGRAGDTLVGLTLRPGRPGRNQLLVYLGPDPPAGTDVRLSAGGVPSGLTPCGPSCRGGTLDLHAGQRLEVYVGGPHGGSVAFTLPVLPAPDGAALAQRATGRMARLQRYRVDEVFSGIRSSYTFARPHRMWLRMWLGGVPRDTLWLGSSIYKRHDPAAAWSGPARTEPVPVPYFGWEPFAPFVDAATVGAGTVDGVPVSLVSFFGGHGDDPEPVWFTLWIDAATDRVLRSQMWAPGHFMDDRYYAFDQPVDMPRPSGG
jgi:hypothetical protein